jgi:ribosome-associated toxin RatA of RatAB toxin-antitoxin module
VLGYLRDMLRTSLGLPLAFSFAVSLALGTAPAQSQTEGQHSPQYSPQPQPQPATHPVDVVVQTRSGSVIIDVTARMHAKREVVWAVLTDYDHMAEFLTTLKASSILARRGNQMEVAQTGEARRGFLHFSFSTVRSVELVPNQEIRSQLISGDFKSYEFTTRIVDAPDGVITIVHHGEYEPKTWVPPVVGPAMIESETRKQYGELIEEIQRRSSK